MTRDERAAASVGGHRRLAVIGDEPSHDRHAVRRPARPRAAVLHGRPPGRSSRAASTARSRPAGLRVEPSVADQAQHPRDRDDGSPLGRGGGSRPAGRRARPLDGRAGGADRRSRAQRSPSPLLAGAGRARRSPRSSDGCTAWPSRRPSPIATTGLPSLTPAELYRGRIGIAAMLHSGLRDAPEERIAHLTVPVTVTTGVHDPFTPVAWLDRLATSARRAPSVRTSLLGGSHNNLFTHPGEVADLLALAAVEAATLDDGGRRPTRCGIPERLAQAGWGRGPARCTRRPRCPRRRRGSRRPAPSRRTRDDRRRRARARCVRPPRHGRP